MDCPACGRPIALARPRCLYCGAALPEEAVAQAAPAGGPATPAGLGPLTGLPAHVAPEPAAPPPALAHVVLDLSGADAGAVSAALGVSRYEAAQRIRRGGLQHHRALPPDAAAGEAARLEGAGLAVLVADADAVQEAGAPEIVIGGRLEPGRLLARTQSGELELPASDLLLVVRGPIRREYQAQPRLRKVTTASLTDGYRFHLHRRSVPAPVELDPEGLEFDDAAGAVASSLLRVAAWVDVIAAGVSVDDAFRFLAPALGTAQEQARARLGAARAIGKRLVESGRDESDRLILDNVRQFRAYSAWRGVAERLRPPR